MIKIKELHEGDLLAVKNHSQTFLIEEKGKFKKGDVIALNGSMGGDAVVKIGDVVTVGDQDVCSVVGMFKCHAIELHNFVC